MEECREGLGVPVVTSDANQEDTALSLDLISKLPTPQEVSSNGYLCAYIRTYMHIYIRMTVHT